MDMAMGETRPICKTDSVQLVEAEMMMVQQY